MLARHLLCCCRAGCWGQDSGEHELAILMAGTGLRESADTAHADARLDNVTQNKRIRVKLDLRKCSNKALLQL